MLLFLTPELSRELMRERKSHYNDHDDDVVLISNESLVFPSCKGVGGVFNCAAKLPFAPFFDDGLN